MSSADEEKDISSPFLPQTDHYSWSESDQSVYKPKIEVFSFCSPVVCHISIALIYFALITASMVAWNARYSNYHIAHHDPSSSPYLPGEEAIEYRATSLRTSYAGNPYAGDPRPEHDKAWSDIQDNTHIKLTEEEMRRLNRTSIALKDGSGYLAELGVYHELHCVKWIRKWIHREHYWPALEGKILFERKIHIDHCLEYLRLIAMCRGSRSVTTYEWYGSLPTPKVADEQDQECVDWEKLEEWTASRRVNLLDVDALVGRPEPQPWELLDHDVRVGSVKAGAEKDPFGGLS